MSAGFERLDDPDLLLTLAMALGLYGTAGLGCLSEIDLLVQHTNDELEECLGRWRREFQRRQAALGACLALAGAADCSSLEASVLAARSEVDAKTKALSNLKDAAQRFEGFTRNFNETLDRYCHPGRTFLYEKARQVEAYTGNVGAGAPAGGWSGSVAASSQGNRSAFVAGSPASAGSGPGGQGNSGAHPGLNGGAPFNVEGRPFADVPLNQIEDPTFAPSEWGTTDVTDMRNSFARLPEIQRALASGNITQLIDSDRGARRVYDWFYKGDSARFEWYQGKWSITNGKHRVAMARSLGLTTLPAHVKWP